MGPVGQPGSGSDLEEAGPNNPAGVSEVAIHATTPAALDELRGLANLYYNGYSEPCPSDASQSIGINYIENIECDETAPPNPTEPIVYYYFEDCCQYGCDGDFPTNPVDGTIDTTVIDPSGS